MADQMFTDCPFDDPVVDDDAESFDAEAALFDAVGDYDPFGPWRDRW